MKLRDFIEHHEPGKKPIGKIDVPWNKQIKNRDPRLPPLPKTTMFQKASYWVRGMQTHHWLAMYIAFAITSVVGVSFVNGIFTAVDSYKNPKEKSNGLTRNLSFIEYRRIYDGRCRLPPDEMWKLEDKSNSK